MAVRALLVAVLAVVIACLVVDVSSYGSCLQSHFTIYNYTKVPFENYCCSRFTNDQLCCSILSGIYRGCYCYKDSVCMATPPG